MPVQRIILLGASNLQRSFSTAVTVARRLFGSPLAIHAAMGLGRSYGVSAGYLTKNFSGIFSCPLWAALQHQPALPTVAFVTDVGNDLGYEQPVEIILSWVGSCVAHLQAMGARTVLVELPVDRLQRVGHTSFRLLRTLLFPGCRLDRRELLARAEHLNAGLQELAELQKTPIFAVPIEWYGWDPIHPCRSKMRLYWDALFALADGSPVATSGVKTSWLMRCYLNRLRPPTTRCAPQSTADRVVVKQLRDGTSLLLY